MGVGVVFSGLVLTYLTIVLIVKVPLLMAGWRKGRSLPAGGPGNAPVVEAAAPLDPEKMAVVAAALEIELRLRKSVANTRFTFRRR